MRIAFLVYDDATQLDVTGPLEVLSRIPEAECFLVGKHLGLVAMGLLAVDVEYSYTELADADILVVPGGPGLTEVVADQVLLNEILAFYQSGKTILSVCTGAIILGACGILKGRNVTTHWASADFLTYFGANYIEERVVEDGTITSSAGVSAGIDAALILVERLCGRELVEEIVVQMQYTPYPAMTLSPEVETRIRRSLLEGKLSTVLAKRKNLIQRISGSVQSDGEAG